MNKLKILLPILLILALLLAVPAMAEEAEDLTAGLTVKVVDKPGKIKAITDGSYKSFWESSNRKEPWVILSSDKPIYGLYLCFQKMPDSFVIEKASGDDWVTVAEGGEPRYHHVFFELDGVKKIRIRSTMEKKNIMGFNEIYAFGQGEVPDWVQRWNAPVEKADLLFLIAHPDDELLFTGGAIDYGKPHLINGRQYAETVRFINCCRSALNSLCSGQTQDIACFDLEEALSAIAGLDGLEVKDDIINEIFSKFCVGK